MVTMVVGLVVMAPAAKLWNRRVMVPLHILTRFMKD